MIRNPHLSTSKFQAELCLCLRGSGRASQAGRLALCTAVHTLHHSTADKYNASQLTATLAVLNAWASGAALVLMTVTKQEGAAGALAEACTA